MNPSRNIDGFPRVATLLGLLLTGSILAAGPVAAQTPEDPTTRSEAELRWAPTPVTVRACRGVDCDPVAWLEPGDSVRVRDLRNGWWAVVGERDGAGGYVASAVLTASPPGGTRRAGADTARGRAAVRGEGFVVTPWYYLRERGRFWVRGLVRNVGEDAAAPLLQATVLDERGEVVETVEFWVASDENIPPGETRPFYRALTEDPAARRVRLRILGRRVW